MSKWTVEHKLYQLKMHFEGNALQILRLLPEGENKDCDLVINRLKNRFKTCGYRRSQEYTISPENAQSPGESVEKFDICLQKLAGKAFPTIAGKEFDGLLRGRFFQALLP